MGVKWPGDGVVSLTKDKSAKNSPDPVMFWNVARFQQLAPVTWRSVPGGHALDERLWRQARRCLALRDISDQKKELDPGFF